MKFVAGIDGGGTKTTLICQTLTGEVLASRKFGPFNLTSIGPERFAALLEEITGFLQSLGQCVALCAGAAGCSSPQMQSLVAAAMDSAGIPCWKLVGDHEIALWGALEGQPGCILIAGTGSICLCRSRTGETFRAGGWGHLIGDAGSGYALGRDALAAIALAVDGCGADTMLRTLVAREKQLTTRTEIISYVYGGDKSHVAAIAPLVEQAADAGDPVAMEIIGKNAAALVRLVEAVTSNSRIPRCELGMLGGLLENDTHLRRAFLAQMGCKLPEISCIQPRQSAAQGAVLMARDMLRTAARRNET